MKKTILLLALTLLLAGFAVAQKSMQSVQSGGEVPTDTTPVNIGKLAFYGVESGDARMDEMNGVMRGNSFVFADQDNANGSSLTVSFDYAEVEGSAGTYAVTSGSWTLMVYQNGQYIGALYGDVSEGMVVDVIDGETSDVISHEVKANFRVLGGMEYFANVPPQEKATGEFSSLTESAAGNNTKANLNGIL